MKIKLGNLIALALIIFIDTLSYYLIIPILLRIIIHDQGHLVSHLSLAQRNILFGFAVSLSPLMSLVASSFIGYYSDQYGRKKILLLCLFGSATAFFLPIVGIGIHSIALVLIGRALAGASDCSQAIAQAAIADTNAGKQKVVQMSIVLFASSLALSVGPFLGSILSDRHLVPWFDVSTPYFIGLGLALFNIVLLLEFFQELPLSKKQNKVFKSKLVDNWRQLSKEPRVIYFMLMFLLVQFSWAMYYQNNYIYLTERLGFSTEQLGFFVGCIGVGISLGYIIVLPLLLKIAPIIILYRISLVSMVLGLCCALIPSIHAQWVSLLLLSVTGAISYAGSLSFASDLLGDNRRGWVMGVANSLLAFSWLVSGFLPSILINISTIITLVIAISLMTIAMLISLSKLPFKLTTHV